MKSSILTVSYLWKDTWKRWFEQPSSPLARFSVTMLLVVAAAAILVAFHLLEQSLRERLERFGLNTLIIREVVNSDSPVLFPNHEGPDPFAPLNQFGKTLRLRQLFVRAQSEWENNLLVMSYPPSALFSLAEYLDPETPLVCLSATLPPNALVRLTVGRQPALARVRRPRGWLLSVANEDVVLAPRGFFMEEERAGYIDTTLYQRAAIAPPMEQTVAALQALASVEHLAPPQLQSALPLVRELENLHARQAEWRNILAASLGLVLCLVYGSIGVLEFRQNLYISALLRSFGTPRGLLYGSHWLENILLANVAAAVGIVLLAALHQTLFATLGVSSTLLDLRHANPYLSSEILSIFIWVNVGAWLSSIPIALGLRRPVGATLS